VTSGLRLAAALTVAAVLVAGGCGDDGSDSDEALSGATLVGGGGDVAPADLVDGADAGLTDLDLSQASHVLADGDGGLWILVAGDPQGAALLRVRDREITDARSLDTEGGAEPFGGFPTERAAATPDGRVVLARFAGDDLWVVGIDGAEDRHIDATFSLGDVAVADDGTILVADQQAAEVVGYTSDDTAIDVVGTAPNATIRLDEPLDIPVSLAAPADDTVAVVTDSTGVRTLRLFGPGFDGEGLLVGEEDDALGSVTATEDGRILVVQPGERVTLIDPAQPDEPRTVLDGDGESLTSVAAVGEDLYALTGDRLWTVEGALGG
jgi:hypothetical protein